MSDWLDHYINVQRSEGLCMSLLQLKDPVEIFVKRREFFFPIPGFYQVTKYDLIRPVESNVKTFSFLP